MTLRADATAAIAVLDELAIRLGSDGWQVQLHAPPDRRPMLHVTNPRVMMLSELVTADQDGDGQWWLWWSWAERISRADDLDGAATVIARVLASRGEDGLGLAGAGGAGRLRVSRAGAVPGLAAGPSL